VDKVRYDFVIAPTETMARGQVLRFLDPTPQRFEYLKKDGTISTLSGRYGPHDKNWSSIDLMFSPRAGYTIYFDVREDDSEHGIFSTSHGYKAVYANLDNCEEPKEKG
jgi:hypothetical protein